MGWVIFCVCIFSAGAITTLGQKLNEKILILEKRIEFLENEKSPWKHLPNQGENR